MTISISGQVPAKAQNGMVELEAEWTDERTQEPVYAVVKIERHGLKFTDDDQTWAATMKFAHIEPLTGDESQKAKDLLEWACAGRGGEIDTELDIPAAVQEP